MNNAVEQKPSLRSQREKAKRSDGIKLADKFFCYGASWYKGILTLMVPISLLKKFEKSLLLTYGEIWSEDMFNLICKGPVLLQVFIPDKQEPPNS